MCSHEAKDEKGYKIGTETMGNKRNKNSHETDKLYKQAIKEKDSQSKIKIYETYKK